MKLSDIQGQYTVISNPTKLSELQGNYTIANTPNTTNHYAAALASSMHLANTHLATSADQYTPSFKASPTDNPIVAGAKSVNNVPSSLMNFAGNFLNAIIHPIDTVSGIFKSVKGLGESAGRALLEDTSLGDIQSPDGMTLREKVKMVDPSTSEQTFNALTQSFKDRYGSLEAAQKTATEDPIGFGADVMSILEGGASALGKTEEFSSAVSKVAKPIAEPISNTISKVTPPKATLFKNSADPGMIALYKKEGITPPISAINKSPFVRGTEAILQKGIFGGKITNIVNEATNKIAERTEDVINKLKPTKSMSEEASGKIIQQGFKEYEDNFKVTEGKLYDEFVKTYGKSNVYGMATKDALGTLIKEQDLDLLGPDAIDTKLKSAFNKITGANDPELKAIEDNIQQAKQMNVKPADIASLEKQFAEKQAELNKNLSFEELKATRTRVGELMQKNPENTALKRLYGALSTDMQTAVSQLADTPFGDEAKVAKDALDKLNQGYATGKNKIESHIAQSISQSSPENIVSNIIKRNSADTLSQLKEMIGPQRYEEITKSFLASSLEKSVTRGEFDVEKFKKILGDYDKETIDQLFSPTEQKNIQDAVDHVEDLKSMGEGNKSGQKMATGSPTAFLQNINNSVVKLSALGSAMAVGNWPVILSVGGELGGEVLLTKLFSSEAGRKLFTEGITIPKINSLKNITDPERLLLLRALGEYTPQETE